MPTTFTCPNCGRIGRLPEDYAKDRVKCPACETISPVPARVADRPATAGEGRAVRPGEPEAAPEPEAVIELGGEKTGPPLVLIGLIAGGIAALVVVVGLVVLAVFMYSMGKGPGPVGDGRPVAVLPSGTVPPPAPWPVPPPTAFPPGFGPGGPGWAPGIPGGAPGPGMTPMPRPDLQPIGPTASPNGLAGGPTPGAPTTPEPGAAGVAKDAGPSPSSEANPTDLVQRIKDATVLIKVQAGTSGATGSGFVIRADGDTVFVATNHHVVNPHLEGSEEDAAPRMLKTRSRLTVVFRSGQGRLQEQSYSADVVGSDRDGNRDLAILKVERVKNPPVPIVLDDKAEPTETMPVLIYGFPFGNIDKMLNSNAQGNPAITINRGSVSSLRRDESNRVAYVQIDGSINPGNSGGPVVDEKGKLVGIAVAAISNTTIGFAIPPVELGRMLDGRIGQLRIALAGEQQGAADLQVQARVIDPLGRIKAVEFLYLHDQPDRAMPRPNPDGTWPPLAGANRVALSVNGLFASAPLQVSVNGPSGRKMLVQASYQDGAGKTLYTSPISYTIPTRPSGLATVGVKGADAGKNESSFASLGALVDPARNCKLTRNDSSLTIEVPGGVHLLSPELDLKSSPMLTTEVEGDFVAQVKVAGAMRPGMEAAKYKGKTLPYTFQGAGLLLWQDKNNYLRLERVVQTTKKARIVLTSGVLLEICKNGKPAGRVQLEVPDGGLYIRLARADGIPQCMFGPDGKRWIALKKLAVPFPDKLNVGISASNASKESLSARFEEFALTGGGDRAKTSEP